MWWLVAGGVAVAVAGYKFLTKRSVSNLRLTNGKQYGVTITLDNIPVGDPRLVVASFLTAAGFLPLTEPQIAPTSDMRTYSARTAWQGNTNTSAAGPFFGFKVQGITPLN
jgi:hypothetical protein